MTRMEQLRARYEQYEQEAREVAENAKPWDGVLGFGNDPRKHACHDIFYRDVGAWTEEFLKSGPTPAQAAEAVEQIIRAAKEHEGEVTFGYLYAAQGFARALIPLMAPEDCKRLQQWYDGAYRPIDRFPLQKEVYKLLKKGAKRK